MYNHNWIHEVVAFYKWEIYTVDNLIRLVIVACSISFFVLITCLELSQILATGVYASWQSFKQNHGFKDAKQMSPAQITHNSQLIVSNVQMLLVLVFVCLFGLILGII